MSGKKNNIKKHIQRNYKYENYKYEKTIHQKMNQTFKNAEKNENLRIRHQRLKISKTKQKW